MRNMLHRLSCSGRGVREDIKQGQKLLQAVSALN